MEVVHHPKRRHTMVRLDSRILTDALMLIGGGVVGAGVALLLAPHSGRRTRREIGRMGRMIGMKGRDAVRKAGGMVDTVGDKLSGAVRDGKKEFLAAVEKGETALVSRRPALARFFG